MVHVDVENLKTLLYCIICRVHLHQGFIQCSQLRRGIVRQTIPISWGGDGLDRQNSLMHVTAIWISLLFIRIPLRALSISYVVVRSVQGSGSFTALMKLASVRTIFHMKISSRLPYTYSFTLKDAGNVAIMTYLQDFHVFELPRRIVNCPKAPFASCNKRKRFFFKSCVNIPFRLAANCQSKTGRAKEK